MDQTPRVVRDPTLLDVFAAFLAHACVARGDLQIDAGYIYNAAELLLDESEVRHGHRPE
jgi:hypothetical protein